MSVHHLAAYQRNTMIVKITRKIKQELNLSLGKGHAVHATLSMRESKNNH